MPKAAQNAYQLLLATRANIQISQREYLLITIIAEIGNQLKYAIDLCESKSVSDYFMSGYYEERQSIIYEADIDDEDSMNGELTRHKESEELGLSYHYEIINTFKDEISSVFSQIFDILCIKYIIDDDLYFLEKIIGEEFLPDIKFLAAAFSGLAIDEFIEANCLELYDDLRLNYPDRIIYANIYDAFFEDLKIINSSLNGGISSIRIQKNPNEKLAQSLRIARIMESITKKDTKEVSPTMKCGDLNERLKQIDDYIDDIPF